MSRLKPSFSTAPFHTASSASSKRARDAAESAAGTAPEAMVNSCTQTALPSTLSMRNGSSATIRKPRFSRIGRMSDSITGSSGR
jgi:hypothetical protein